MDLKLKIFGGPTSEYFTKGVCDFLKVKLGKIKWKNFSDGERVPVFEESLKGSHVFFVQSTGQPDSNLMNLLLMIDAAKRTCAEKITVVIPYYGYARQDRKGHPRNPITAKLVADLIERAAGRAFRNILTMDFHAGQIQGFFDGPVDHLYYRTVITKHLSYYLKVDAEDWVVLGPDSGAVGMARSYAKILGGLPIAVADKRRPEDNVAEIISIVGDVEGKKVLTVDDMIDTAGTLTGAASAAMKAGAAGVWASCTHPVLSGNALERIENSAIQKIFVSNSIVAPKSHKIEVVNVTNIFAEAIWQNYTMSSVSSLF